MTSPALHTYLPRLRGSRRAHVRQAIVGKDFVRHGTTALRGSAILAGVFGAVGGIMSALVLLAVTALLMLGLFAGVFAAVPVINMFSAK